LLGLGDVLAIDEDGETVGKTRHVEEW
jgi:hypothetical protein